MAKLILTLDTENGHIDWDYPEEISEDVPPVLVSGTITGYLSGAGEHEKTVVAGWNISVQVGELPEERERRQHIGRLLKWRQRQQQILDNPDYTGVDQEKLEGAIELCNALLSEMGHVEPGENEKEPTDDGEPPEDSG